MKRHLLLTLALAIVALPALAQGAPFTPVALASLARAAGVVTVTTASAHGLAQNQGFCIVGVTLDATFNACATITTVPTATTFTFPQNGAASSIAAGGTVAAAKRVIVLMTAAQGPYINVTYLLWNTTTQGLANSALTSLFSGAGDATFAAELTAIKAGTTIETPRSVSFPNTLSAAQIQTFVNADWLAQQNNLAAGVQPGQFYGAYCDAAGCSF